MQIVAFPTEFGMWNALYNNVDISGVMIGCFVSFAFEFLRKMRIFEFLINFTYNDKVFRCTSGNFEFYAFSLTNGLFTITGFTSGFEYFTPSTTGLTVCLELLNESRSDHFLDHFDTLSATVMTNLYIIRILGSVSLTNTANLLSIQINLK